MSIQKLKTNMVMKRDFDGILISQRTSDSFFNATEMLSIFNLSNKRELRLYDFFANANTSAYIQELENEILNNGDCRYLKSTNLTHESKKGRGGATWMHPYLFVKFCFWLSPKFEVKVIKWVYDNLIDLRHEAGNYSKEMGEAISSTYSLWYKKEPDPMVFIKEYNFLNTLVFNSPKGNQRNTATEFQLDLMTKLQKLNTKLINDIVPFEQRRQKLMDFAYMYKMVS